MNEIAKQNKKKAQVYLAIACLALVSLAVLYVYFLSVSVIEVVVRKQVDSDISSLHSDISELEAKYISMQHSVSQEIAMQHGFVKASKKTFVDRGDTGLVLSDRSIVD